MIRESAFWTEIQKKAGWPLQKSGRFKSPSRDWSSIESLCSCKTPGSSKSIEWNRMLTCRSQKLDFESRLIFQGQKELAYRVPPHYRVTAIFRYLRKYVKWLCTWARTGNKRETNEHEHSTTGFYHILNILSWRALYKVFL